eukprot:TRINITY_DN592_c0_g1_i8.p1 TRINITY_DN592_c0_g1~~TRINITY_DN592_c0_g1_i8.p1  ORF type:complete len:573 (+),score=164.50 TRINITY_DN592_c0_g1_i8:64-1782(+)
MRALLALAAGAAAWEVQIPMRDGYTLGTAIGCDKNGKNLTVVMERSTYSQVGTELIAVVIAEALGKDFCAVRQDMRGTGFSNHLLPGGVKHQDFTLWRAEGNDTHDTNEWIQKQPWSNGRILQVGVSSDGLGTLSGNMGLPPGLDAEFVIWASVTAYDTFFPGGAYRKGLNDGWLTSTFPLQHKRLIAETRQHEAPGEWWNPVNMSSHCDRINSPSVFWAGWYDIFLQGNLVAFDCAQKQGGPKARGQSRIIVDPCGHCQAAAKSWTKDLIYGRAALPVLAGLDLFSGKGKHAEFTKEVTFYVMGAIGEKDAPGNHWTTLHDFPEFTATPMYFGNDGSMSSSAPQVSAKMEYVYDPANPVPTMGGNNLMIPCGPKDQSPTESRDDVLVFTTPVLEEPMALTGPIEATLFVASNATDTDFTVKLTDVNANGTSSLIQDGIVRMRWRKGTRAGTEPSYLTAGTVYEVTVSLWNTSHVFAKGHRVRAAVSSSNSPRFEPNPNTGRLLSEPQLPPVPAANTLLVGGETPSHITLPVVPLRALPKWPILDAVDSWLAARPASWRTTVEAVSAMKLGL